MTKTKVVVRTHPGIHASNEQTILLSESIVRRWRIPTDRSVQLRCGSIKLKVKVMATSARGELRISNNLAHHYGLGSQPVTLRLAFHAASQTIRLGPVIGVMLNRITNTPGRRFGIITAFCRELTDASRNEGALVYFFTPDDIRSTQNTIDGWAMGPPEYHASFPVPDVIYNRLPSRKLDNEPGLQQFLKSAKSQWRTSVFNEKYLDKTEVFQALRQHLGSTRYLPESHACHSAVQLKSMCAKYRVVFLKPITGSLGKGILRISRNRSGYQVSSSSVVGVTKQEYSNLNALATAISGKMRSGKFQIQQGLNLIEVGGRPVDFRALVQKNISNRWKVTSIVARTAGNNRFVSNVAQGGTVSTVGQTVNKSNMNGNKNGVSTRLQKAALTIASGIESRIPYHFGELGIDLALDQDGRVWLLEVNSKPSKNDSSILTESAIRPSVRQVVQYARYLAGL
ncbi:MAG: YheC/YheD family protein [Paenibacillaceae bacterium]